MSGPTVAGTDSGFTHACRSDTLVYAIFLFEPQSENGYRLVPETVESWDGPNLYAFVRNDALNKSDYLSLQTSIDNMRRTCAAMPTPAMRAKWFKDLLEILDCNPSSK
jgi:hypothetical protein